MAAYKAGIKTVIIPKDNKADLDEIDDIIKSSIHFVFAETLEDVLDVALVKQCKYPHDEYVKGIMHGNAKELTIHC